MNERIREMMDEANQYAVSKYHELNPGSESTPRVLEIFSEKFAELIVRECCLYLNSEAERLYALGAEEHRPNFKEDFEICAEKCYDNIQGIKEHFGVES